MDANASQLWNLRPRWLALVVVKKCSFSILRIARKGSCQLAEVHVDA